jgi:H+/Cl- antiporter ClcA
MFIKWLNKNPLTFIRYILKWLFISVVISLFSGTASALFLNMLHLVEEIRLENDWLFYFLPIGGGFIGLIYFYWGKDIVKGNNLIIEEYHVPNKIIPFKMAPMIFLGTLITHLFGGSAGREGTAVQMSGSIADQLNKLVKFTSRDRKILLIIGVSAGFASVFGTPLAGAIFALEIMIFKRIIQYDAIFPAFITGFLADYISRLWGVEHTRYFIIELPALEWLNILWCVIIGIFFGLGAYFFKKSMFLFTLLFNKVKVSAPLKPVFGGLILLFIYIFFDTQKFAGLGIETIQKAFLQPQSHLVFIGKILLTSFTLSAGFKGGEVTPLFFIGATLGSFLSLYFPLPLSLLAALGFVSVFAGATHTPIACSVMGLEIFGIEATLYFVICVYVAHHFSGKESIYSSQKY